MHHRLKFLPALALGVLAFTGCGSPAPLPAPGPATPPAQPSPAPTPGTPTPSGDVVVRPETHVVGPQARGALDKFTTLVKDPIPRYELRFRLTPETGAFAPGQVLVSEPSPNAPFGYLVRATDVRREGDVVIVTAVQARLDEAIERGGGGVQIQLTPDMLAGAPKPGPGVTATTSSGGAGPVRAQSLIDVNKTLPWSIKLDKVLYDNDDNTATTDDQVGSQGTVNFALGLDLQLNLGGAEGDHFLAKVSFDEDMAVKLFAHGNFPFDESQLLVEYPFEPIVFFIGPVPVVIEPILKLTLDAKGKIKGDMTFELQQGFSTAAGTEFRNGQWKNISSGPDLKFVPGTFQAQMNADVKVGPTLTGEMLLYGVAGAYADLGANLRMKLQYPASPWYKVDLCAESNAGVTLDLIMLHWKFGGQLFEKCGVLGEASNQPPVLGPITAERDHPIFGGSGNPNGPLNTADDVRLCVKATDPDPLDQSLKVVFTSDKDAITEIADAAGCIVHRFETPGTRVITATAKDHEGLQGAVQKTLEITKFEAPAPVVTIQSPTANQTFFLQGATLKLPLVGFSLLADSLPNDCKREKWESSDPTDVMPANNCGAPLATLKNVGPHTFTLTALNADNKAGKAQVTVNVLPGTGGNQAPTFALGIAGHSEQPVDAACDVTLTANMILTDADNDPITYELRLYEKGKAPSTGKVVTSGTTSSGVLQKSFHPNTVMNHTPTEVKYILQLTAKDATHSDPVPAIVEIDVRGCVVR